MNTIANKPAVGVPHSKARYHNATHICADCLESEKEPHTLYNALCLDGKPLVMDGICYVCEQKTRVARVEAIR